MSKFLMFFSDLSLVRAWDWLVDRKLSNLW